MFEFMIRWDLEDGTTISRIIKLDNSAIEEFALIDMDENLVHFIRDVDPKVINLTAP